MFLVYSLNIPTTPSHFQLLNDPYPTVFGDILDRIQGLTREYYKSNQELFSFSCPSVLFRNLMLINTDFSDNCINTLNVLQASNACASVRAFVRCNFLTDKVYAYKQTEDGYIEEDPLGGFDPLQCIKSVCWNNYRFISKIIYYWDWILTCRSVRAGNVIGGGDWAKDRLIPDLIKSTVLKENNNPLSRFNQTMATCTRTVVGISFYWSTITWR